MGVVVVVPGWGILLDHIPVQLRRLVQAAGMGGGGGGGGSSLHCRPS